MEELTPFVLVLWIGALTCAKDLDSQVEDVWYAELSRGISRWSIADRGIFFLLLQECVCETGCPSPLQRFRLSVFSGALCLQSQLYSVPTYHGHQREIEAQQCVEYSCQKEEETVQRSQ